MDIIRRDVCWPVVRKWWRQNNRVSWFFPQTDIFKVPPGFLYLLARLLCRFCPQCQDHHAKFSPVGNITNRCQMWETYAMEKHILLINIYGWVCSKLSCFIWKLPPTVEPDLWSHAIVRIQYDIDLTWHCLAANAELKEGWCTDGMTQTCNGINGCSYVLAQE